MEWLSKNRNQDYRVRLLGQACLSQWLPVKVNEQSFEVCWNPKLASIFVREAGKPYSEKPLRLHSFECTQDLEEMSKQIKLQGSFQGYGFCSELELTLKAPGVDQRMASQQNKPSRIRSPMVGKVLSVRAELGQLVQKGDELLVIEAMKMENKIFAPSSGIVESISCQQGQQVALGEDLLSLKAAEA